MMKEQMSNKENMYPGFYWARPNLPGFSRLHRLSMGVPFRAIMYASMMIPITISEWFLRGTALTSLQYQLI